jgi:hypothetical protein
MVGEEDRVAELRAEATRLRLRAAEHQHAGNAVIALKLSEVAEEFEALAARLEEKARSPEEGPLSVS